MYYKSPFKSAIIREKQKPLFSARFAARTRKTLEKQKAAFIGEICCANSEKRQKSNIVNYRMYLRRGVLICPIG